MQTAKSEIRVKWRWDFIVCGLFSGNFLFIETSFPRRNGDKAWLYSPFLDQAPKGKCLNFWYHMYGSHIGSLNIYLDRAQGASIWNRTGNQGNVWRHGRVNLQSYTRFRVCQRKQLVFLSRLTEFQLYPLGS